jgi:FkbM family methyltransferase
MILGRLKSAALWAMRELASVPLRTLGNVQRGRALEKLTATMVSNVPLPGGILHFMTPTPLLQARASSMLSKEPDTCAWIDSFELDDVFWDVGANVGVFCLYAARRRGVRVLAFEPSADNYVVLCRNVEANSLDALVVPYCIALAGATELGVLNSPSREMGAALHQFGRRGVTSRYSNGRNNTITSVLREWWDSRLMILSGCSVRRFLRDLNWMSMDWSGQFFRARDKHSAIDASSRSWPNCP